MRTLNVISNSLQQLPKNEYTEIMWREIQKVGRQIYLSTAGKGLMILGMTQYLMSDFSVPKGKIELYQLQGEIPFVEIRLCGALMQESAMHSI